MNKYRHNILGFAIAAGRFPNGHEDGVVLKRRGGFYPPVRLPIKYWDVELIEDYEITGYWIRMDGKIVDVGCTDYLLIRESLRWVEPESEFWRNYTEEE